MKKYVMVGLEGTLAEGTQKTYPTLLSYYLTTLHMYLALHKGRVLLIGHLQKYSSRYQLHECRLGKR
jgi:hypothetical protein